MLISLLLVAYRNIDVSSELLSNEVMLFSAQVHLQRRT